VSGPRFVARFVARCLVCAEDQQPPFPVEADCRTWSAAHNESTGHEVYMVRELRTEEP